jgi:hypothetical protein
MATNNSTDAQRGQSVVQRAMELMKEERIGWSKAMSKAADEAVTVYIDQARAEADAASTKAENHRGGK